MSKFLATLNAPNTTIPQGIINNDQGFYQNIGEPNLSRVPLIYLAYLSNTSRPVLELDESDVIINLNPVSLKWCDFTNLFFKAPGGAFWVNPSNATSNLIIINNQTYETTQNRAVRFTLADQIRKAWSKKNAKTETQISPNVNILLNRAGFLTKSLALIKEYMVGLSIDEAISSLLNGAEIEPGNSDTSATVKFVISYKDYFAPLNTSVLVNFTYITKIPCYKNKDDCFIDCGIYSYSKDSGDCRACLDDDSSRQNFSMSYKKPHVNVDFDDLDDDTVSNHSSSQSQTGKSINAESVENSYVIDELSKIIKSEVTSRVSKVEDDDTCGSSKWT